MKLYNHPKLWEAFDIYVREQVALLPDDDALAQVTLSPSFHARMRQLLARRRRGYYVLFGTAARRVATIVLAALVSLSVITVSVEAWREPVWDFFARMYERFTQVAFADDAQDVSRLEMEKRTPTYLPEGYAEADETELGSLYRVVYKNHNDGYIMFTQRWKDGFELTLDTESAQYTNITVDGYAGIAYENKGDVYVAFADDTYAYTFSGATDIDELIKIAESLEKK